MKRKYIKSCLMLSLTIVLFFSACMNSKGNVKETAKETLAPIEEKEKQENLKSKEEKKEVIETPKDISIVAAGNTIYHMPQVRAAYNGKRYDFNDNFKYISSFVKEADLSLLTVETNFYKKDKYSGYPNFNTPPEALRSIKNSGFDIVNFASNHVIDKGENGFRESLQEIKKAGLEFTGVQKQENEKKYTIKNINGIKVGIISYVYETEKINGRKTINGILMPNKCEGLINTFDYSNLEKFYEDIKCNIDKMKQEKVDYIMALLHWGDEYSRRPNEYQKNMSKKLNEMGVDAIIGGHPHVIQPYETIENKSTGHKTFVTYSLGNLISNQCYESLNNRFTEDGYMVKLNIKKQDGKTYLKDFDIVPTWVFRKPNSGGGYKYKVLPVDDVVQNKNKYNLNNHFFRKAQMSLKDTKGLLKMK